MDAARHGARASRCHKLLECIKFGNVGDVCASARRLPDVQNSNLRLEGRAGTYAKEIDGWSVQLAVTSECL